MDRPTELEERLAVALAEVKYADAKPKQPPAWAMEKLRQAVGQLKEGGK
jgi:hypothetical protein